MEIAVLIPAYQPDAALPTLVSALRAHGFRIIVVDDGSGAAYASLFAGLEAEVLTVPKNRGKGHALKVGMRHLAAHPGGCTGFITADADGQHTLKDILRVCDALLAGNGFVLTVRRLRGSHAPARSRFGNALSRFVFSLAAGSYLPDNQSGLRGLSMAHLPWLTKISGEKYDYEMNVLLYASRQELPMTQLPIETVYLEGNQSSHFDPLRDTLRIYARMAWTGRASLLAGLLHMLVVFAAALLLNWGFATLVIPLAAFLSAGVSYLGNRFWAFRAANYRCGPRMLIYAAVRATIRLTLCGFGWRLGLWMFWAWLLAAVLALPLEYGFVKWTSRWWEAYAIRRS